MYRLNKVNAFWTIDVLSSFVFCHVLPTQHIPTYPNIATHDPTRIDEGQAPWSGQMASPLHLQILHGNLGSLWGGKGSYASWENHSKSWSWCGATWWNVPRRASRNHAWAPWKSKAKPLMIDPADINRPTTAIISWRNRTIWKIGGKTDENWRCL